MPSSDSYHYSREVNNIQISLDRVDVPGFRIINGYTFPLALVVKSSDLSNTNATKKFLEQISSEGIITDLLNKHGAILLRGLGDSSAQGFSKFVTAIETSRGRVPFQQIGLAGKRHQKAENVFTANEGPPNVRFYQHNEYARYNHFPSNINFFCNKVAPIGGGSPIASSIELFELVNHEIPEFIRELSEKKLISVQLYPSKTFQSSAAKGNEFYWEGKDSFGHELEEGDSIEQMKQKAERQVRKLTDDFSWNQDGSLTVRQHLPAFRQHPVSKKPVFFNGLLGRYGTSKDREALDPPYKGSDGGIYMPTTYENGELVPRRYLEKVPEISKEIEFNHIWEEGDLILIDNYQVSHGREPWHGGERIVLVSMWDDGARKPREYTIR